MSGLNIQLLLERERLSPEHGERLRGVVRLVAGQQTPSGRVPVDLVACLDVSGSMRGGKLAAVRHSVSRLARELQGSDRLGLVTFSSHARVQRSLEPMDHLGKEAAQRAIAALQAQGNTRMSDGVVASLEQLQRAEGEKRPVRRVLLFTDGHANAGVHGGDRKGWATLIDAQLGDASVSWFGFGEDHDAALLSWLADRTGGNAYVARDEDAIADAFARELGGLLGTVAQQVKVRLRGEAGAPRLLNDERTEVTQDALTVTLSELSSEEQRDLVFELPVAKATPGTPRRVVEVEVSWVDPRTGKTDSITLSADATLVDDGSHDEPHVEVLEAVALQEAAQAMRSAAELAERRCYQEAEALLEAAARRVREAGTERAREVAALLLRLAEEHGRGDVYRANRSKMSSVSRLLGKQRSSGSEADHLFETRLQREMRRKFDDDDDGTPPALH